MQVKTAQKLVNKFKTTLQDYCKRPPDVPPVPPRAAPQYGQYAAGAGPAAMASYPGHFTGQYTGHAMGQGSYGAYGSY
jgi:hypothetical protein